MIVDAGFTGSLYTADGSGASQLAGGTLDGVVSVINFGDTANVEAEFANLKKFRTGVPRMNGEYWCGWFDHWGEKHHVTNAQKSAAGVEWMLSRGISFNLYMVHGGTSWGYMSGANGGRQYEPDTSAYDYDSPLDEAGRPTAKFHAIREVISKYLTAWERLPDLPESSPVTTAIPRFDLAESAPVTSRLLHSRKSDKPLAMEFVGQSYGFILYRTKLVHGGRGTLEIIQARDFAVITSNNKTLGTLDRRLKQSTIEIDLPAGATLDILVENMGRINFGPLLVADRKGIVGKVTLNGEELSDWEIFPLPLDDAGRWPFSGQSAAGPALFRGAFQVAIPADTFLDMRGWGKGVVFVNGHNAGRYWEVGPQQTLFVPAPWIKSGANEVIVLDLLEGRARSLQGLKNPVYATPV